MQSYLWRRAMSRSVRILFPSLTHNGKIYDYGEVESEPTPWLVEAAKKKLKMFHRDSNKEVRVAKFVESDDEASLDPEETEEKLPRVFTLNDLVSDEDLEDKMKPELSELASSLGLKDKLVKKYEKDQLKKFITFMRKL